MSSTKELAKKVARLVRYRDRLSDLITDMPTALDHAPMIAHYEEVGEVIARTGAEWALSKANAKQAARSAQ